MKRFYRLLCVLSVAGAVVATACSESGDDMPKEVEFGSETKNQTVYADAETANDINFTAKAAWTATVTALQTKTEGGSSVEWLTLDRYSGQAGEFSLKMNIEPNYTGETRKAQIEIVCGETTIRIIIEQKGTNKDGSKPEDESEKKPPLDANGNIQFPDPVFAAFMVENFDKDGDCGISPAEAAQITSIYCDGQKTNGIISIHGIQYCTALVSLTCSSNHKLPAIKLSKFPALTRVTCSYNNKLTVLSITNCPKLTSITCGNNKSLTEFNFSGCTELTYLDCRGNQLTTLDVSKNTELTYLDCSCNNLAALDISKNTKLTELSCYGNRLTALDVSKNTELTY